MKPKKLLDESPMPFGKHEGMPMRELSADYLHRLWIGGMKNEESPVADYIRRCIPALKKENPDLIWS